MDLVRMRIGEVGGPWHLLERNKVATNKQHRTMENNGVHGKQPIESTYESDRSLRLIEQLL